MPGGLLAVRQGVLQDLPVGGVVAAPILERLRPVHTAPMRVSTRLAVSFFVLQIGSMAATTSRTSITSTGMSPSVGKA